MSYFRFGAGVLIILFSFFSWRIVSYVLGKLNIPPQRTRKIGWRLMGALVSYALLVESDTIAFYLDFQESSTVILDQFLSAACTLFASGVLAGGCRLVGIWERTSRSETLWGPLSQAGGIVSWTIGVIIAIGYLLGKGPWGALTAVGAFAAVGLLVFKDPLLGLMASIQMRHSDAIRRGDWITMPSRGVDGEVIEVTLWSVRVLSYDRSTMTFPTYSLISDTFQNWRSMTTSEGRRMILQLFFDVTTIVVLRDEERNLLSENYGELKGDTNLALWRSYVENLFESSPWVDPAAPHLVRVKELVDGGLGVEIYCFSRSVVWPEHEKMRSALMEHLLLSSRAFSLRIRQKNI